MGLDIEPCLNENNKEFYRKHVETEFYIELVSTGTKDNVWGNKYKDCDEDAIILAGNDYPNPASFSHEMLHLYLYANGFSSLGVELLAFYNKPYNYMINSQEVISEITNSIAHYKMMPLFVGALGHKKILFFAKWNRLVNDDDILILETLYQPTHYKNDIQLTNYIKYFFYTRYHFDDDLDSEYNKYQKRLKKIDTKLYNILLDVCTVWDGDLNNFNNTQFFHKLLSELETHL